MENPKLNSSVFQQLTFEESQRDRHYFSAIKLKGHLCYQNVKITDIPISKAFTFAATEQECTSLHVDKGITGALSEYKARSLGGRVA